MINKPISQKTHILLDYALIASLLIVPPLFDFNKKVKNIYTTEALVLFAYLSITDQPAAIKPLLPIEMHGKIDPINIAQFGLQSFLKPFRKDKKALAFNIAFTLIAGTVVALTNWKEKNK